MANKGFTTITSVGPAGDGTHSVVVSATPCVILDQDDNVVGTNGGSIIANHDDNAKKILDRLTDNIRENNNDPDLRVVFL